MPENDLATIFESDYVKVVGLGKGGPKAICTFTSHKKPEGHFTKGYGETLFQGMDITSVFFISSHNHWWQCPEMQDALSAARSFLSQNDVSEVLTHGASMGGFAAIQFAEDLGAQRVLAIAPQADIWDLEADTRWRQEAQAFPRIFPPKLINREKTDVTVLLDLFDEKDALQASHLGDVNMVPVRHCGHRIVPYLQEIGALKPIVLSFVNPKSAHDIPDLIRSHTLKRRRFSSTYMSHLLTNLIRRRKNKIASSVLELMDGSQALDIRSIETCDYISFSRSIAHLRDFAKLNELVLMILEGRGRIAEHIQKDVAVSLRQRKCDLHAEILERVT